MKKIIANAILTIVLAAVTITVLVFNSRIFAPQQRLVPTAVQLPDFKTVLQQITPESMLADLEKISGWSTRFSGTPGCDAVGKYISDELTKAGYVVTDQPFKVTVPVTKYAYLLDESGKKIESVSIHPLLPNRFRTATIVDPNDPNKGVTGKVFKGDEGLARDFRGVNIENNFVLLPLGRSWATVAGMGARAVLYYDDGKTKASWGKWHHVAASMDVPRFMVKGDPNEIIGKTITIKARVDFEHKQVRNIIGALIPPSQAKSGEAVIISAYYDSYSFVPDIAPGAEQACGVASMLGMARRVAGEKDNLDRAVFVVATVGHAQGLAGAREFLGALGRHDKRQEDFDTIVRRVAELTEKSEIGKQALKVARREDYWAAKGKEAEKQFWASVRDEFAETPAGADEKADAVERYFKELFKRVVIEDTLAANDAKEAARVVWIRSGQRMKDDQGEKDKDFHAYDLALDRLQRVRGFSTIPPGKLKEMARSSEYLLDYRVFERVIQQGEKRLGEIDFELERHKTRLALAEKLAPYERVLFLSLELTSRSDRVALICGDKKEKSMCMPTDEEFAELSRRAGEGLNQADPDNKHYLKTKTDQHRLINLIRGEDVKDLPFWKRDPPSTPRYIDSLAMLMAGHVGMAVATPGDDRAVFASPQDTLEQLLGTGEEESAADRLKPLTDVTRILTGSICQMARGQGRIVPSAQVSLIYRIKGKATNELGGIFLNAPDALVYFPPLKWFKPILWAPVPDPPGVGRGFFEMTDWEGNWVLENTWPRAISQVLEYPVEVDMAVVRPDDGAVTWVLSEPRSGPAGTYPTWGLNLEVEKAVRRRIMGVMFRAAPVQAVVMHDPATFEPYPGFDFLEARTLSKPDHYKSEADQQYKVCFVPPSSRVYLLFKKGAKSNPNLMVINAFATNSFVDTQRRFEQAIADAQPQLDELRAKLQVAQDKFDNGLQSASEQVAGITEQIQQADKKLDSELNDIISGAHLPADKEIAGPGYLAADSPRIANIEFDAAVSMGHVNYRRELDQQLHGMTDKMVTDYVNKGRAHAIAAVKATLGGDIVTAKEESQKSLAYNTNIHSVILKRNSDAIYGIVFYLALALPFTMFMEKLLIGHPDLRYQIAYECVIFILFFLALRMVHPAYGLVRSSYMILLGFITLTLSVVISIFIGGKFSKNVSDFRMKLQKQATAADVSRGGAAATAFLLGLNNMRKRPVRTGLTMGTLILITFVMICFTSVQTDIVDIDKALGKAEYTGLLKRGRNHEDMSQVLQPTLEQYGEKHIVAPRYWAGDFEVPLPTEGSPELATYKIEHIVGDRTFTAIANGFLGLSANEPLIIHNLTERIFLTLPQNKWFESENEKICYLPKHLADLLQIRSRDVQAGTAIVKAEGTEFKVAGIFEGAALDQIQDLDGQSLCPIDIVAGYKPTQAAASETNVESPTQVPEAAPRLAGDQVVIVPYASIPVASTSWRLGSIAIKLTGPAGEEVDYSDARQIIDLVKEQTGEPAYYGLGGFAFYGVKLRMGSLTGLLDMVLPIIIAAITVLNTMRGSVYERKNELYVFNAVGLAPNHILWLFMAEACVYAVVGTVGGYLLAQGVGTGIRVFGLTAGITMNYSSISGIVVCLIIMATVFISSLFPARMAARLAAPAETMTRRRTTTEGDVMELELPFTFNRRDRVAIMPYFMDWFDNFGEGSSGLFFCSPPQCGIRMGETGQAVPYVKSTTWLKPYDLGVSQNVELVIRRDPDTGDNIAFVVMTLLSGDHASWERCNHKFIGMLRKRFLTWRAISDEDRDALLERARKLLDKSTETQA